MGWLYSSGNESWGLLRQLDGRNASNCSALLFRHCYWSPVSCYIQATNQLLLCNPTLPNTDSFHCLTSSSQSLLSLGLFLSTWNSLSYSFPYPSIALQNSNHIYTLRVAPNYSFSPPRAARTKTRLLLCPHFPCPIVSTVPLLLPQHGGELLSAQPV